MRPFGLPRSSRATGAAGRSRVPRAVRAAAGLTSVLALGGLAAFQAPSALTVRSGDTLWAIAARNHTTVTALAALNHLSSVNRIQIGQVLQLPGNNVPATRGASAGSQASQRGPASQGGSQANQANQPNISGCSAAMQASARGHRAALAARPAPTRVAMRALIVTEARRAGLDPNLALAVSWQESGLNPRVVSACDAIGAMQVLPTTSAWLATSVLHRPLDILSPNDNVLAGVTLLRLLVAQAPTTNAAVGGYYQGLASVEARGLLPDTAQYVRNVLAVKGRV